MTTYALEPEETPALDWVIGNCRLIANLPLSGQVGTGQDIYIDEPNVVDPRRRYWIIDRTHDARVINRHFEHLHEVLRRALANNGWGEYTITPPEGINW